jgi:cell division protein FtsZ
MEAAEEVKENADPEANIIFGTSFNERLGDEVMITVIATGFDGTRRREPKRQATAIDVTPETTVRQPRDFLEELERQRSSLSETGALDTPPAPPAEPDAPPPPSSRSERPAPEPAGVRRPAFDADDLEIPSFLRRNR